MLKTCLCSNNYILGKKEKVVLSQSPVVSFVIFLLLCSWSELKSMYFPYWGCSMSETAYFERSLCEFLVHFREAGWMNPCLQAGSLFLFPTDIFLFCLSVSWLFGNLPFIASPTSFMLLERRDLTKEYLNIFKNPATNKTRKWQCCWCSCYPYEFIP